MFSARRAVFHRSSICSWVRSEALVDAGDVSMPLVDEDAEAALEEEPLAEAEALSPLPLFQHTPSLV